MGANHTFYARYPGPCKRCGLDVQGKLCKQTNNFGKGKATYHVQPADCPGLLAVPASVRITEACREVTRAVQEEVNPESDHIRLWRGKGKAAHQSTIEVNPAPDHEETSDMPPQDNLAATIAAAVAGLIPPSVDETKVRAIVASAIGDIGNIEGRIDAMLTSRMTQTVKIERPDAEPTIIGDAHERLATLLRIVGRGHHAYLYDAAGGGKSHAARQVAESLGRRFGYISGDPRLPDSRFIGFQDAHGTYHRTPFRECFEHGGVFCIDEMDNLSGSLLVILNGALENGHMAFPDGLVSRHKDFVVVGTGNTSGRGASAQFPERRPFDAAFAERFTYLRWTYDSALERSLSLAQDPTCGPWIEWVTRLRRWAETNMPKMMVSPRASIRGAAYWSDTDFTPGEIADMVVFKGLDDDAKRKALTANPLPVRG